MVDAALPQPLATMWSLLEQRIRGPQVAALINIGALVIFTFSLAGWTWQIFQPNLSPVIAHPVGPQALSKSSFDLKTVLDAHLFGEAKQSVEPAKPALDQVPLSSLNLVLTGVVAAGDESIALISVSGQPQSPFAIGDEVHSGAILDAVYPDRAILQRAGVLESLLLKDFTKDLPSDPAQAPSFHTPAAPTRNSIRSLGDNNFSLPRKMIGEQLKNPDFLRDAHIVPRKEGGFLVRRIKPGSLYEKLGLKRGDIIQSVNGESLKSMTDVMGLYQNLNTMGQVQVEVIRNGQPQMLQFNLEE